MIEVCEIRSIVRSSPSRLCSVDASISLTFFERFWRAASAIWFSWLISAGQSISGSLLAGLAGAAGGGVFSARLAVGASPRGGVAGPGGSGRGGGGGDVGRV